MVATNPSVTSAVIGASADPAIPISKRFSLIPFTKRSRLYKNVAQAPALAPVTPTEPRIYALMKSADISNKDIDKCLELALFPFSLDCINPPMPRKSNCPMAGPEKTPTLDGSTKGLISTSQSIPE